MTCADPATLAAGGTRLPGAVDAADDGADQPVAERRQPLVLGRPLGVGGHEGGGEGGDAGHVVRAAAALALLPAADDQRLDAARRRASPGRRRPSARRTCGRSATAGRRWPTPPGDRASTAPGRRRCAAAHAARCARTTAATSARSVTVPTSLLTAITLTMATSSSRADDQLVEVDPAGGVDADDRAAEVLDDVEDGVVLGRRADGPPAEAGDGADQRGVVALGATAGEHDLAGAAPDRRRRRRRGPRRRRDGRRGRSGASRWGWRSAR